MKTLAIIGLLLIMLWAVALLLFMLFKNKLTKKQLHRCEDLIVDIPLYILSVTIIVYIIFIMDIIC